MKSNSLFVVTALITSVVFPLSPVHATAGCSSAGSELNFKDINGCHAYYPAIAHLVGEKIVQGYPDGTFRPEAPVSRVELVKMVMGAMSSEEERSTCVSSRPRLFPDAPSIAWYGPYLCTAKQRGVIGGYPDGTFRPGNFVSYAEAAKIVSNAFRLRVDPQPRVGGAAGSEMPWFFPFSETLRKRDAIPPTVNTFDALLTRGEVAELIYRVQMGKTSFEWFEEQKKLGGDGVLSEYLHGMLREYSFEYPGSVFATGRKKAYLANVFAPGGGEMHEGLALFHSYPEDGCGDMSDRTPWECRPTATDISMGFFTVPRPLEHVMLGLSQDITENEPVIYGERRGFQYEEGVENEGRALVFLPLDAQNTLVIERTFNRNLRKPEYLPAGALTGEEQDMIAAKVLKSLRFSSPLPPSSALTMTITLFLCESRDNPVPTKRVTRTVPKTSAVGDSVLRRLISEDFECGTYALRDDYLGLSIINGVATVKLRRPLEEIFSDYADRPEFVAQQIGRMRSSVEKNLKQFSTVRSVRFEVER